MKIGFTGTRDGMSTNQRESFALIIKQFDFIEEFHHGDCKGADFQADRLVRIHDRNVKIKIHPPDNDKYRAFCKGYTEDYPLKPYLERDRCIVDSTDLLIATPKDLSLGGGTGYTITYAKSKGKPIIILR